MIKEINEISERLSFLLEANEIDPHIVCINEKTFNGIFFLEDFSEKLQEWFIESGSHKVKVSKLITSFAQRVERENLANPPKRKSGKNDQAIELARVLVSRNKRLYGKPLNKVVFIAVNVLFDTEYSESDISNLANR